MALNADVVADPYYLHPFDNPGLILVSQPLTEENYASWSRAMRVALSVKNKFGLVDGSIAVPDADLQPALYQSWSRSNNMVISWLLNSISKEILPTIVYYHSAAEIWSDLQDRFK